MNKSKPDKLNCNEANSANKPRSRKLRYMLLIFFVISCCYFTLLCYKTYKRNNAINYLKEIDGNILYTRMKTGFPWIDKQLLKLEKLDIFGIEFRNIYTIEIISKPIKGNKINDFIYLEALKKLVLIENKLTDLTILEELESLSSLRTLYLYRNLINNLAPLSDFKNLESLGLSVNKITDLTPLIGLTKLKSLTLSNNNISDLSPLTGLKNLSVLYIESNKITDITPLRNLTNLIKLRIDDNQITELTPLTGLTKLTELDIANNPNLTKAEIAKLQKALPNCKFNHNATK